MISELSIEGFRCFRSLSLSDLGRINVIVGPSGSGKTALLEAMALASSGNPEIHLYSQGLRGIPGGRDLITRESYRSLWRDLFFGLDTPEASIRLMSPSGDSYGVVIRYLPNQAARVVVAVEDGQRASEYTPISFEWLRDGGLPPLVTTVDVDSKGRLVSELGPFRDVSYVGATSMSSEVLAQLFSALSRRNAHRPFVSALRNIFPRMRDISVEAVRGTSLLYAEIAALNERIPLAAVSSGITKFAAILLSMLNVPGGTVLVDEAENGFYHRDLLRILTSLIDLARENNVQLCFTTHSQEFLDKLVSAAGQQLGDVRLLRTTVVDGHAQIRRFVGLDLQAAVEEEVEVR